ncbi:MAG TPA: hypothetical protein VLH09_00755 [Bryobacteraceae bacterium]|nr:hypothetical protein [Bryobacteraceae bacterium]
MKARRTLVQSAACVALFLLSSGATWAQQKLMHCFYFTPIETATAADWDAFNKATEALPGKIPGLTRVWSGKLRMPQAIFSLVDREAAKKLRSGEKSVSGEVTMTVRQHGVCMEMDGPEALKVYAGHPAHKEWDAVYQKVRQYGTSTFDIVVP